MATAKSAYKPSLDAQIKQIDPQIMRWFAIMTGEIIFAVLLGVLVIMPQLDSINQARSNLDAQQKVLSNLQNKSELLSNFNFQYAQKDDLINKIMPDNKEVGLMLTSVRKVAQIAGVDIVGYVLNPGELLANAPGPKPATTPDVLGVNIELTVDATPVNTRKFLDGINRSLPLKSIENLQVLRTVTSNKGDTSQLLETKINLKAYYLPPEDLKQASPQLSPFSKDQESILNLVADYTTLDTPASASGQYVPLGNQNLFGL